MRLSVFAWLAIGFLGSADPALAWGKWGHLTVCEYTYRLLTDDARAELNRLMAEHPAQERLEANPNRRRMTSFNFACFYADKNEFSQKVESPRHFFNLERSESVVTDDTCRSGRSCIFDGIREEYAILSDTTASDAERADAIVMLGHWLGDLHQPLHISFKDDLGGNEISKKKRGRCSQQNLHAIWDTCILEQGLFKTRITDYFQLNREKRNSTKVYRYVDDIEERYPEDRLRPIAETWLTGNPLDWANESYSITRQGDVQYCVQRDGICAYDEERDERPRMSMRKPPRTAPKAEKREYEKQRYAHNKKVVITQSYIDQFAPVVEERLMQSSMRLSDMINAALDPNYNGMPDLD